MINDEDIRMQNASDLQYKINCISIFILVYEIFEDSFEENIKEFYAKEWSNKKGKIKSEADEKYKHLFGDDKNKKLINWCLEHEIFSNEDCKILSKINKTRNNYVDKFYDHLIDTKPFDIELLQSLITLYNKFDNWWIKNFQGVDFNETTLNVMTDLLHSFTCVTINAIVNMFLTGREDISEKLYDMLHNGILDNDAIFELLFTPKIKQEK